MDLVMFQRCKQYSVKVYRNNNDSLMLLLKSGLYNEDCVSIMTKAFRIFMYDEMNKCADEEGCQLRT